MIIMITFKPMEVNNFVHCIIPTAKDLYARLGFRSIPNSSDDTPLVSSKMSTIVCASLEAGKLIRNCETNVKSVENARQNEPANEGVNVQPLENSGAI